MIENCINVYNDCSEFYWKVLGEDWQIETDKITGKVTLPKDVLNSEDFRVWAHGPLNGEISKIDTKTCIFSIENMPTETFLELRIVFPTNIVNKIIPTEDIDKLDSILKEEQKNAEDANRQRKMNIVIYNVGIIINIAISCLFGFFSLKKLFLLKREYNEKNTIKEKFDFQYFRDIPNSKMDPVEATIFTSNKIQEKNIVYSLFMSLAYKKIISIKPGKNKEDTEIKLYFDNEYNDKIELLTDGEIYLAGYLKKVGDTFTIKQFEKYINSHAESFYNSIEKIKTCSSNNLVRKYRYIDLDMEKLKTKIKERIQKCFINMFIYYFIISMFFGLFLLNDFSETANSLVALLIIVVELIYLISGLYLLSLKNKVNIYTDSGNEEHAKWKGLKKFLEDFSMIDEREIPELVLWEQFLVYATGFGIAKKVLKQLKARFPELSEVDYFNYPCFYMTNNDMFSHAINDSVSKAITVHNYQVASSSFSSGSGGGGGFSSGGGGGRRWRPVAEEDKAKRKNIKKQYYFLILFFFDTFFYFL